MDYRDLLDAAVIGTKTKPVEVHAEPTADDFFLAHLYNEMLSLKKQNEELLTAVRMMNDANLMRSNPVVEFNNTRTNVGFAPAYTWGGIPLSSI